MLLSKCAVCNTKKSKFIKEIHLKQPGFTCSACGPFTKNKERIKKFQIYLSK